MDTPEYYCKVFPKAWTPVDSLDGPLGIQELKERLLEARRLGEKLMEELPDDHEPRHVLVRRTRILDLLECLGVE